MSALWAIFIAAWLLGLVALQRKIRSNERRIVDLRVAVAWEKGYLQGVADEAADLERADNPYLAGDQ